MIGWLVDFINTTAGALLYWSPLAFCVIGYTARTWLNYQKDVSARTEAANRGDRGGYYSPTDTVGTLVGRALAATVPGINLFAAVFDLGPDAFRRIEKALDIPLVPRK